AAGRRFRSRHTPYRLRENAAVTPPPPRHAVLPRRVPGGGGPARALRRPRRPLRRGPARPPPHPRRRLRVHLAVGPDHGGVAPVGSPRAAVQGSRPGGAPWLGPGRARALTAPAVDETDRRFGGRAARRHRRRH